jgi:Oligoribonuclease (3''->5'' exoribonuclease)
VAQENPALIWIDCEMTGLNLASDALIEIAVLVTDSELNLAWRWDRSSYRNNSREISGNER